MGLLPCLLLAGCGTAPEPPPGPTPTIETATRPDLLDHRGAPSGVEDWSFLPFSDQGSWLGWSLPPDDQPELRGGFGGPFLYATGKWLAPRLVSVNLDDGEQIAWEEAEELESLGLPGLLVQRGRLGDFSVELRLWIDSTRTTLVEFEVRNDGPTPREVAVAWSGEIFGDLATLEDTDGSVRLRTANGARVELLADRDMTAPEIDGERYSWALAEPLTLASGTPTTVALAVTWALAGESEPERGGVRAVLADSAASLQRNRQRWRSYLDAVHVGPADDPEQILAVKALQTLVANWRGPAGRMRHSSLFPSSNIHYFNGYWAWDSWKHAVALVRFDPELAKSQVRAMFDHQDERGMIADVVYLDPAEDNWRDTKPPLAGWAIQTLYEATGDLDFVRQLYPALVRYHRFWTTDRDHDGDGLCEYGSTDGTLVAARWESGMDNAVRFDHSQMFENGPAAWSLDQESVDLNSYLVRERRALEALARALGEEAASAQWADEAARLAELIRATMFDPETGWFYDTAIESGEIVPVQGPEGWTPLWTGVATPEQAEQVRRTMLDPERFRTPVPFPTVARDDPGFSEGYWRGLVWLDQVYFAIEGLRNYGYHDDAAALRDQLFQNLQGATEPGVPLYENYHPLTGEGRNVRHFSWTAAHLLLLTQDQVPPEKP